MSVSEMPMKYIRRIAIGLAVLIALIPLFILGLIVVTNILAGVMEGKNPHPPGEGIILAETSLPGDDAILQLAHLIAPVNEAVKSQDCLGIKTPHSLDWDCLNAILKDGTNTLLAFDEWRSGPSRYKLERPEDLNYHIRIPGPCFCPDVSTPDWTTFQTLAKLLGYRTLKRLREGNYQGAEQDLHAIFLLGTLLQQNPILVEHMIAISVYKIGGLVIAKHLPPEAITSRYASLLPESKQQIDAMRFVFGAEWQGVQEILKQELPMFKKELQEGLTSVRIYDHEHTLRLIAEPMLSALGHLDRGVLASPAAGPQLDIYEPCPKGVLWLRNPLGRIIACIIRIDWTKYNGLTGQSIDRVEAARVVIAARMFKRDQHRWPAQVEDLVPSYLKVWPMSALDGKPLRWLEDKHGVQVLAPDGINPCKENELCEFTFEPSEPIRSTAGTKRVRPISKHRGYFPL
jgi:hypothetical protein